LLPLFSILIKSKVFLDFSWGFYHIIVYSLIYFGLLYVTGNVAVARSYISAATTEKERSTAMSALSSVQGLGFILGPGSNHTFAMLSQTYMLS